MFAWAAAAADLEMGGRFTYSTAGQLLDMIRTGHGGSRVAVASRRQTRSSTSDNRPSRLDLLWAGRRGGKAGVNRHAPPPLEAAALANTEP
jgi:hypothetical protein